MDTMYGFIPLPEEGTEAYGLLGLTEECNAMHCRGDAGDPYEAADLYGGMGWCPGYCTRYKYLTLPPIPEHG